MALFHVKQSHHSRTAIFQSKSAQFLPTPGSPRRFLAQAELGSMWANRATSVRTSHVPCWARRVAWTGSFYPWISLWITLCITLERSVDILRRLDASGVFDQSEVVDYRPHLGQQSLDSCWLSGSA